MRALFYALKIFRKIPKGNFTYCFDLNHRLRCFLTIEDKVLAITLSYPKLCIESHRKIDLSKGKWYLFKEILCEVRTMI